MHPDDNNSAEADVTAAEDTTASDDVTAVGDTAARDDVTEITNELFRYAELIDAGRFTEVGELMEHCTFHYGEHGAPGPAGAAAIAESYRSSVMIYADGTPRTRHLTTNPIVEVDGDVARVRSVYTVLQQVEGSPMQAIISGRYHDTLTRIDGRWRFIERTFLVDLVGDLSGHLRFELPSSIPAADDHTTDKEQ